MRIPYVSDLFAYVAEQRRAKGAERIVAVRAEIASSFFDSAHKLMAEGRVKGYQDVAAAVRQALQMTNYDTSACELAEKMLVRIAAASRREGNWSLYKKYFQMHSIMDALAEHPDAEQGFAFQISAIKALPGQDFDMALCALKSLIDTRRDASFTQSEEVLLRKMINDFHGAYLEQRSSMTPNSKRLRDGAVALALAAASYNKTDHYSFSHLIHLSRQRLAHEGASAHYQVFLPTATHGNIRGVVLEGENSLALSKFGEPLSFEQVCRQVAIEVLKIPSGAINTLDQLVIERKGQTHEISVGIADGYKFRLGDLFKPEGQSQADFESSILSIANEALNRRRVAMAQEIQRLKELSEITVHWRRDFLNTLDGVDPLEEERVFQPRRDGFYIEGLLPPKR